MNRFDDALARVVGKVALTIALIVALVLPVGYFSLKYQNLVEYLDLTSAVKAEAIMMAQIADNPEYWQYQVHGLMELLSAEPFVLGQEAARIRDVLDNVVAVVGAPPPSPVLRRSSMLHDSGRAVGHVEVELSLRGLYYGTTLAGALGLLLGAAVFATLRVLPLRALRRVTDALAEQKRRAEVTLQSIGDAVITTNAAARIQFMNPVAERLTGWALTEARDRPVTEILRLIDTATGNSVPTTLRHALFENRIISFERDIDLVRRDGSRIGIADNAAPICGPDGKIAGGVLIFRDVSAARRIAHQRAWEARHDSLTGLVNRREFECLVERSVDSARNAAKQHVVCYLDLDQFKVVNDTCGHAAGDELLKELGALLQSRIRESDTLARLGGDEFGLMLEGCSLERAQLIAADLLAAVADFRFTRDGRVFIIGVSIGLATVTGDTGGGAEAMSLADTACYWAKEQGRNRVCVYRTGDSDMAARRREMSWIARINSALLEDRFTLYQQSYLPLNGPGEAREHIEVLLRMIDEGGNLVQPGSFLPAAERYNLMPAIDRWVVSQVFARYRAIVAQRGGRPLTCAINLSGTSLNAEGFLDFVRRQAREHALPMHSICFEITETAAITNLRKAAEFIKECKSMGFLFALDDFGTGSSSFGYLKNLRVDYLKIDGGFVKNLERDAIDKAMTETINRIGHIMGIKTVAEYAENEAIIQQLKNMGVDYAQGYGVCRPTPLTEPSERSHGAVPLLRDTAFTA